MSFDTESSSTFELLTFTTDGILPVIGRLFTPVPPAYAPAPASQPAKPHKGHKRRGPRVPKGFSTSLPREAKKSSALPPIEALKSVPVPVESYVREVLKKPSKTRAKNQSWNSKNHSRTDEKQLIIMELLRSSPEGMTVREVGEALSISRQLALYHLKKMAAQAKTIMQLEPCRENRGIRYRCWDEANLAAVYQKRAA